MANQETYVCDADSLINLHRHFESECLPHLESLAKRKALRLPEGVVREIKRGTDKLAKFVEQHEQLVAVTVRGDERIRDEIRRLEQQHGETIVYGERKYAGFWKSRAGREAADSQVVAVAKVLGSAALAVSDDQAVKLACSLEGVSCIGWTEFTRRLGITTQPMLPGL